MWTFGFDGLRILHFQNLEANQFNLASVVEDGGDRSPKTKAVRGYRAPKYPQTPPGFLLGTGPKPYEIWHSGYYPVVWTNKNQRVLYLNTSHNDIDYEPKYDNTNKTLSYTLNNTIQDRLIIDGLFWLGDRDKKAP